MGSKKVRVKVGDLIVEKVREAAIEKRKWRGVGNHGNGSISLMWGI